MPGLLKSLLSVIPVFWFLLAGAYFMHFRGKKPAARWLFGLAFGGLLLASTGPLPILMISALENRYDSFSQRVKPNGNKPLHILVLGGGHTSDARLPATNQLSVGALARLVEGIRIHRLHPESRLILSGYPGKDPVSNAQIMFEAALLLGVEATNMDTIPQPENTRQEAMAYLQKFGNQNPLIIVSTATHITRAMIWFRKAGLNPIPAPTHHSIKKSSASRQLWWLPDPGNIILTDRAIYEYAGIIQAKLSRK